MHRLLVSLSILLVSLSATAQQTDPEWPCVQVLVPEINLAVVWPQAIDESLIRAWKKDPVLVGMVERLSDLDEFTESEQQLISDFIQSVSVDERNNTLNKLADGILSESNQRRKQYIRGIKRYTRQQISIASQIESTLNQLSELDAQTTTDNAARQAEIEETLHWHQRVYDRREHSIQALCERPVELEEKLSRVLRELAQYLP